MRKHSTVQVPILSFFSKSLYQDVGLEWKGVNFCYLLVLLTVCWIPTMFIVHKGVCDFVDNESPAFVEQVPEITITDGEVSIEEAQPYYIKDPDSGDALVVIDTTGGTETLEDANAVCLLTKSKVMWRKSEVEVQTYDLKQVESFVLNGERVTGWLEKIKKYSAISMYPFAVLGSYVYRIVQALIYAVIGLLFASWCRVELSYSALLRLAITAVTPCIMISTILGMAGGSLPVWLYPLIALGYLFFAVKSISELPIIYEESEFPEEMES